MNHNAIRKAYPSVITIDDAKGCFDAEGNSVEIDDKLVTAAAKIIDKELQDQAEAKATAKAALLNRLGITAEEAVLLLS